VKNLNEKKLTDEETKHLEKYGGKPYGEIKCPFFTHSKPIPDELNKETICTKCWSKYDYHCYFPKNYKCDQYNEMIKTLNPEYLKSIVDAMRTENDLSISKCSCEMPIMKGANLYEDKCECDNSVDELDNPRSIGQITLGKAYITVLTYDAKLECSFIVDGNCSCDVGIKINDESE